jgi:endonuclease I
MNKQVIKLTEQDLHNIIKEPEVTSYNGLWEAYRLTDMTPDGKVWDMYSDLTNFTDPVTCSHSYSKEGDGLNREHSFPKSWFGGSDKTLMYSDVQHVIPTDGYVNMQRSNYPYGEVYSPSYVSHNSFSKLGPCAEIGYTKKVFEPNDEYKGDLARIYFYMATCYEDVITDWYLLGQTDILTNNSYKPYVNWHMQMLMRWAKEDAVSDKEVERNHGCYRVQGNRNPFIDYPDLVEYIWGEKQGIAVDFYTLPQSYGDAYDEHPSALSPSSAENAPARKEIRDGQVFIIRNSSIFTLLGQPIR